MKLNKRSEAGMATLEMALALPLLLLVVFAILELGLAFARLQVVQNAAREGARAAVLFDPPCSPEKVRIRAFAAVDAFSGTLGMGTLPNPTVTPVGNPPDLCGAPFITVTLSFPHQIPLTSAFGRFFSGTGGASLPLPGSSTAATQPTRSGG